MPVQKDFEDLRDLRTRLGVTLYKTPGHNVGKCHGISPL